MGQFFCCKQQLETIEERNIRIMDDTIFYVNRNYGYMSDYNKKNYIHEIYWKRILDLDNKYNDVYRGNIIF